MTFDPLPLTLLLIAYLLGSISTGIITCKLMGLNDPRSVGSNNPGATNVLRHGGKKAAIITLLGDMMKGLLPVLVVRLLLTDTNIIALTGVAAFLGHLYPVYYKFKGGKGVATFFGVLLGYHWIAGLIVLATWLLATKGFKISALSALVSALASPFIIWYFSSSEFMTGCTVFMATLLYWRHRSNIKNMLEGKENKIGVKKPE